MLMSMEGPGSRDPGPSRRKVVTGIASVAAVGMAPKPPTSPTLASPPTADVSPNIEKAAAPLVALAEGVHKKVYVDPADEKRVILEMKTPEGEEKDSPRLLQGTYYLTEIARVLQPTHIPEIYEVSEAEDGVQKISRQRIALTPGHALLEKERRAGIEEYDSTEAVAVLDKEITEESDRLQEKFESMGLISSGIRDTSPSNYSRDTNGEVYYLNTFKPWEAKLAGARHQFTLLFDEKKLARSIKKIPDKSAQEICNAHLAKIKILFEEEKIALQEADKARLIDCGPMVQEVEAMFVAFEAKHDMPLLLAITTEAEAFASKERIAAKEDILRIAAQLKTLQNDTNIIGQQYNELYDKYKALHLRAIGTANRGVVSHE